MNTETDDFESWWDSLQEGPEYAAEECKTRFASEIDRVLLAQGINQKELAKRLDMTPARVSKLLRGDANCTIETMSKVAYVLGEQLHIGIGPRGRAHWFVKVSPAKADRKPATGKTLHVTLSTHGNFSRLAA